MAIDKIASVAGTGAAPTAPKESFAKVASSTFQGGQPGSAIAAPPREAGVPVRPQAAAGVAQAHCPSPVTSAGKVNLSPAVAGSHRVEASRLADQVLAAQQRLDRVLEQAQSGRTFTPTELLSLQAHVYSASQELDLAGKVVEKATSGLKTLLQTQL
ncbi:MAG: ATP-dependent helicase HrpB [Myxococcota bacterium]|nr:ATP-dependent helicase HrpB [Myxococcota bacterium]